MAGVRHSGMTDITASGGGIFGDAEGDLIGFYGAAPIARPANASQSVVTSGIASAVATGAASGVSSGYATLLITNSPASALGVFTSVADLTSTLNAINAIISALNTLGTSFNNAKTQLDQSTSQGNAIRNALSQTSGLGLIKGLT